MLVRERQTCDITAVFTVGGTSILRYFDEKEGVTPRASKLKLLILHCFDKSNAKDYIESDIKYTGLIQNFLEILNYYSKCHNKFVMS